MASDDIRMKLFLKEFDDFLRDCGISFGVYVNFAIQEDRAGMVLVRNAEIVVKIEIVRMVGFQLFQKLFPVVMGRRNASHPIGYEKKQKFRGAGVRVFPKSPNVRERIGIVPCNGLGAMYRERRGRRSGGIGVFPQYEEFRHLHDAVYLEPG